MTPDQKAARLQRVAEAEAVLAAYKTELVVGPATDCATLCCLCRRHHRLKTHASGWRYTLTPDGVLIVSTPSGVTRVSRPPGMRSGDPSVLQVRAERQPLPGVDPPPF